MLYKSLQIVYDLHCPLFYFQGCMEEIEYLFSKNLQYIGIAGLCVAVVQVMIKYISSMDICNIIVLHCIKSLSSIL